MAKIIGEAGIRLRSDQRGLAAEMRGIITKALREASTDLRMPVGENMERDTDRSAGRVRNILSGLLAHGRNAASGLAAALAAGQKLALIGTAAAVGLAGVTSLFTGVVGLVGVLGQAAGVIGLLPAALLAVKAVTATVTLGTQNLGESFSALASGDAAAFRESLKALAPNARAFVQEVAKVKPAFDTLKLDVQNTLFTNMAGAVGSLAQRYLPLARDLFVGLAKEINTAAFEVIEFTGNAETAGHVSTLIANIKQGFHDLIPAIKPALSAFLNISTVGSQFLPQISTALSGATQRFAEFIGRAAASGRLHEFFQTALDTLAQLGQVAVQIGGIFGSVFKAAQTAGGGFLGSLLEITRALNGFLSSAQGQTALISFFTAMRGIIAQVIPILLSVAQIIATTVVPILADLARIILPAINVVVQQFGAALAAARPGITALAQGIATMLEVFGPTITLVVQLAGILGGVLGKVLQTLAPVLARVANAFINGLIAVMPKLEPVILAVADAIVQLLDAATPLIPIFLEVLTAVLPILPPLIQLVASVLPPLIGLIQALMPIIQAFAQILIALIPPIQAIVQVILGVLIPPIRLIAAVVSQVAQLVAAVFQSMSGAVTTILNVLGSIIAGIWGTILGIFTGAVNAIGSFVRGGFEAIRNTVSNILGGISRSVSSGLDSVIGFFRDLPGRVLGFLNNLAGDAFNAGRNIVQGIINGLGSLAGAIVEKLRSMVAAAWDAVTSFFGIASPSKLARDDFMEVGRGAIQGLERMVPAVRKAAAALAAEATASMNDTLGSSSVAVTGAVNATTGATAGGGGLILQQTNVMQPGSDVTQFASEVTRRAATRLSNGPSALPVSVQQVQNGVAAPGALTGVSGG